MKKKHVDVVVAGAGNGGLGAAVTTSKAGLDTLVLERHNLPGGAASSFVRGRFEFEPSLHELAIVGPENKKGLFREQCENLGIDVDWRVAMEMFHFMVPSEKIHANMPCGKEAFIDEMERQVPGSRKSVAAFMDDMYKAMDGLWYMYDALPDPAFRGPPGAAMQRLKTDSEWAQLGATAVAKYLMTLKFGSVSIEKCLDLYGVPKKAQNIITTYWVYLGAPPKTMDALTYSMLLWSYCEYGIGQPSMKVP